MIGLTKYKTKKDSPSVSSTLLPDTIIINLVLIGLLVEELMVVGSRSD